MDFINFLLAIISAFICFVAVRNVKKKGVKSYNIFLLFFFGCLLLNTTKLSIYQRDKTMLDMYYLMLGPFIVTVFLYIAEHHKLLSIKSLNKISVDWVFAVLLGLYIATKLYISSIVGWRIDSFQVGTMLISGDELTVPGFSGLAISLQWTLLMLCPSVSRKRRWMCVFFCISLCIFAFLHVKRGDVMRMIVFFLALFMSKYLKPGGLKKKRNSKIILKLSIFIALILFIFVTTGNIRQEARGVDATDIIYNSGVKIENPVIAWLYSYFAINVDVLKLYYPKTATGTSTAIMGMIAGDDVNFEGYDIGGFNASTFLCQFIIDYQEWFFVELILFSLILLVLIVVSRSLKFSGMYFFNLSILMMFPFGNYFQSRAMCVAMFFFVMVSFVMKVERQKEYYL